MVKNQMPSLPFSPVTGLIFDTVPISEVISDAPGELTSYGFPLMRSPYSV